MSHEELLEAIKNAFGVEHAVTHYAVTVTLPNGQSQRYEWKAPTTSTGNTSPRASTKPDDVWRESLKQDPLYRGIDIDCEWRKANIWCAESCRIPTKKFFINWLLRRVSSKPASTLDQKYRQF